MRRIFSLCLWISLLVGCATTQEKVETVFYPMPPQTPRLQFLTSINSESDLGSQFNLLDEFVLGKTPSEKSIVRPYGIAAEKGKIYVVDRTYNKVLVIDLAQKRFDYIRDARGGALAQAIGIFVTQDGHKYVADAQRGQIVVFNERNEFIKAYGEENQFRPTDVAVYGKKVFVCDIQDNEVEVLDRETGKVLQKIGGTGSQEGSLYKPTHITVDGTGSLYVTDSFNFRVQKFDPQGSFVKSFGYQGDTLGGFVRPKGLAIDREGHLYVVDAAFENVQIFDEASADLLLFFGGFGPDPGSMYLPAGIFIDYENVDYFRKYVDKDFKLKYLVYVSNQQGNHKLNVYGFGEWTGPAMMDTKKPKEMAQKRNAPPEAEKGEIE